MLALLWINVKGEKTTMKETLKNKTEKVGGFVGEFKKFITRGNVMDMAVGVIIGAAFGSIVSAGHVFSSH